MYNISFIDFGVTGEPLEVNEMWMKTMYICLFVGGGFGVALSPSLCCWPITHTVSN